MGNLSEEECSYFDAYEDFTSRPDAKSDDDCFDLFDSHSGYDNSVSRACHYEVWFKSPGSVEERRSKFLKWFGIGLESFNENSDGKLVNVNSFGCEIDRDIDSRGTVLCSSGFANEPCSPRPVVAHMSVDGLSSLEQARSTENFRCRGVRSSEGREVGSQASVITEESEYTSGSSPSSRKLKENDVDGSNKFLGTMRNSKKLLCRLRSITCSVDKQCEAEQLRREDDALMQYRLQRTKVHQCGKRVKELSALYEGQDIQGHKGSILTMKFSPDGQYLATGGEDGVVRVWQVLVNERSTELDIPEIDPSCIYFTVNHISALKPLFVEKEKTITRSLRTSSDSACVIFPPNVFRLVEKPMRVFHGHRGQVLDLSWSRNHDLLSASDDKTVRLWRVGCESCLGVFLHVNYVTSVQFNPVDGNYFMSGSIDGIVRIWSIPSRQVIDWAEVKDIVISVCYRPDGQGAIVGTVSGNCRFYSMLDGHLQLDAQLSLHGKKKHSPCNRITGIQFCPQDSSKVMVTCADSQVRILQGHNLIGKFRGQRSASNQLSACFTSDGKHIISASENSNVYLWNFRNKDKESFLSQTKSLKSYERFSTNATIALPWCGLNYENSPYGNSQPVLPFSSPSRFSLSEEYIQEMIPKGSVATWPEEKLPISRPPSMHRSHLKFLKASCQNTFSSHAWGLVIVTASQDGRIRSFHNYGLPVPA